MRGMIVNRTLCQVIIGCALFAPSLIALAATPQSPSPDNAVPASTEITAVAVPAQGTTLRVLLGRTLLLRSRDPLKRVSVTDHATATAVSVSPNEIIIHGLSLGTVTLNLRDEP